MLQTKISYLFVHDRYSSHSGIVSGVFLTPPCSTPFSVATALLTSILKALPK